MMQEQTTYITGNELAKQLGVSPRTIRSDIVEINQNILPYHAKILSARSKGYLYTAENPEIIQQLNQILYQRRSHPLSCFPAVSDR